MAQTPSGHQIEAPAQQRDNIARATRKQLENRMQISFQGGRAVISNLMRRFEVWELESGNSNSKDSVWVLKEIVN